MTSGIHETQSTLDALGLTRNETKKPGGSELGADQFMELMLAQMRNQDPLEPLENGQFLAQIAQFSTVSGIKELQVSFGSLATSLQSNQALQASSLVGRTVLVAGPEGRLAAGGTVQGEIALPASTGSLTLSIYDSGGQRVRQVDLGQQPAGDVTFSWDGTGADGAALPPGTYTFEAESPIDGQVTALETSIYADVESVDLGRAGQGIRLNLAGLGSVNLTDVIRVR